MLFQRCFADVETTSINIRRLNFHFQPNINVEITLMNVDDQRCFNVKSTLMCLLGNSSVTVSILTTKIWARKKTCKEREMAKVAWKAIASESHFFEDGI